MTIRRITRVAAAAGTAAALVAAAGAAQAAGRNTTSVSFWNSADSDAHWGALNGDKGIVLDVAAAGWAGADLKHHEGTLLADITDAPSFVFVSSESGQTGGGPRITVVLSDGGTVDVRTDLPVTAGVPVTVTSDTDNVDSNGGACGYRYDASWSQAVACHPGAAIVAAFVVDDSGWLLGQHTSFVDDVQFGGTTISGPGSNAR